MSEVDHGLDFIINVPFVVIPYIAWGKQGYRAGSFYKLITKSETNGKT